MRIYSQYYHGLDKDSKRRYDGKLNLIGENVDDPYTIPLSTQPSSNNSEKWPDVEYPDIYNYLVNTRSPYTKDMLKAYKSLEGYKYFTAGWVSNATLQELPSSVPMKVLYVHTALVRLDWEKPVHILLLFFLLLRLRHKQQRIHRVPRNHVRGLLQP